MVSGAVLAVHHQGALEAQSRTYGVLQRLKGDLLCLRFLQTTKHQATVGYTQPYICMTTAARVPAVCQKEGPRRSAAR